MTTDFNELLESTRELYAVLEKPEKALKHAKRLVDMHPNSYEALNLLAAILYELDRDDESYIYYSKALELEPNSVEALEGLTSHANDLGDYKSAISLANRALEAEKNDPYTEFKENPEYHQRLIAQVYIEKAYALYHLDKIDEAKDVMLNQAKTACPLENELFDEEWEILIDADGDDD